MKCSKTHSTLTLPAMPQPQAHTTIKPILTYSMTLDRNKLQKLQKNRLYVRKLDVRLDANLPSKRGRELINKGRSQLKNMKNLTHLKAESPSQKLFDIFHPFSNSLGNLRKFDTDIHEGEYDMKSFLRFMSRMKRLSNFEIIKRCESPRYASMNSAKIQRSLHIYMKAILRNLSVTIGIPVGDFLSISTVFQRFVKRTHSSVSFYPRNYSTHQYLTLLSMIEQNYKISEPSLHLASVLFNFHQRIESQEKIVSHITSTWTSLKEITLSFEINSTNWFVEQRVDNWKRVAEAIVARLNKPQPFKIIYNIIFNNQVNESTLQDMIIKAASLIKLCWDNQAKNYTEVNVIIDCPKTLYGLEDFVINVLKTMGKINKIKYESRYSVNDCDRQALSAFEDIIRMKKSLVGKDSL